jgi:hypothetical protein
MDDDNLTKFTNLASVQQLFPNDNLQLFDTSMNNSNTTVEQHNNNNKSPLLSLQSKPVIGLNNTLSRCNSKLQLFSRTFKHETPPLGNYNSKRKYSPKIKLNDTTTPIKISTNHYYSPKIKRIEQQDLVDNNLKLSSSKVSKLTRAVSINSSLETAANSSKESTSYRVFKQLISPSTTSQIDEDSSNVSVKNKGSNQNIFATSLANQASFVKKHLNLQRRKTIHDTSLDTSATSTSRINGINEPTNDVKTPLEDDIVIETPIIKSLRSDDQQQLMVISKKLQKIIDNETVSRLGETISRELIKFGPAQLLNVIFIYKTLFFISVFINFLIFKIAIWKTREIFIPIQ